MALEIKTAENQSYSNEVATIQILSIILIIYLRIFIFHGADLQKVQKLLKISKSIQFDRNGVNDELSGVHVENNSIKIYLFGKVRDLSGLQPACKKVMNMNLFV